MKDLITEKYMLIFPSGVLKYWIEKQKRQVLYDTL